MDESCFGLIGGLGVGATAYYYQELAKAHANLGKAMQLIIAHADLNRVLQYVRDGEAVALACYFANLVQRLADAGARTAAIPAVTPHFCFDELIPRAVLPLVSIAEQTSREIRAKGIRRVALLGTRFVIERKFFGMLGDVDVVAPLPQETDDIHRMYLEIVSEGRGLDNHHERLSTIANTILKREGVDAIVLAGTELSLVFNKDNANFPFVDCTRLHIESIMARMVDYPADDSDQETPFLIGGTAR